MMTVIIIIINHTRSHRLPTDYITFVKSEYKISSIILSVVGKNILFATQNMWRHLLRITILSRQSTV